MAVSLLRARTTVAIANLTGNIENSFTFATPDTPNSSRLRSTVRIVHSSRISL